MTTATAASLAAALNAYTGDDYWGDVVEPHPAYDYDLNQDDSVNDEIVTATGTVSWDAPSSLWYVEDPVALTSESGSTIVETETPDGRRIAR